MRKWNKINCNVKFSTISMKKIERALKFQSQAFKKQLLEKNPIGPFRGHRV